MTPSQTCTVVGNLPKAQATLLAVDRGLNRFFSGNTVCGICHFNPEFTGATVSALTGFGKAPLPPIPPGQARKIAPEVPLERMIAFNGAAAVYDSGFYNLGIRPTPEDLSIGGAIDGVPLAFTKLAELIGGGNAAGFDAAKIALIAAELDTVTGILKNPTAPNNLTPIPWGIRLACGPGLNGNGAPNNNPNSQCVPNVITGERLLRNGAFKASSICNVKFTGPYFHNGAKLNLSQVFATYSTAGHFTTLNFNNLDAGLRLINIAADEQAAVLEMMETGLTDWGVAYEKGKFDHPEICVPNGHNPVTGQTILADISAVGRTGNANLLQTFEENKRGITANRAQTLTAACNVTGISTGGLSDIDVP